MAKIIDARGLSCPQPVLLTYKAIEAGEAPITVTVDNPAARENIRRMAEGQKKTVTIREDGEDFILTVA